MFNGLETVGRESSQVQAHSLSVIAELQLEMKAFADLCSH